MYAIKKTLCLISALLLLFSTALAQDLIAPEEIVQENANYKTYEVFRGDFVLADKMDLEEYYPLKYDVIYEGETAFFLEYLVKRGDVVKKGDKLATVYYEADETKMESMRLSIQRSEEDLARMKEDFEEEIREMEAGLFGITDLHEKRLYQLRMERRKVEQEQSCYALEYSIENQREALDEMMELYEQAGIYAEVDGVVEKVNYKGKDDFVYNGEVMVVLNDPNTLLLTGSSDKFRYNMDVSVEMGHNQNRYTIPGRVVCADNVLPPEVRNGRVFIRLLEENPEERLTRPSAKAETRLIEDVLLVDRRVLTNVNGNHSVMRLGEGNTPQMRYVNFVRNNSEYAWIVQGVSVGDQLIDD